ncbi:MAG TPA: SDR family oxidoreductase [Acidimicrobiia bacterium]|jgi:NAD(P)-dependent dehydrogenase (short-subunit alcohol dehydrogenase family)
MDRNKFNQLFDLSGRVAVVTGGTRGIGRAIAEGFVCAGAKVVVASRKPDACRATEADLTAMGGEALGVPAHLGDLDGIDALIDATVTRFGAIDIVVNNAANALTQPATGLTPDAWEKSYAVNLRGPVFLAKAAHPYLAKSTNAAVLNVLSVGALTYSPGMGMYTAAKAAMLAWTRNLAAEWVHDGIRVNALAPGTTDTDMVRNNGPEAARRMAEISLMRRAAHADEMVGPALFLCSDASSFVTGALVVADGGYAVAR